MKSEIAAYGKVKTVIESCETFDQLACADRMIDCFAALYGHSKYKESLDSLYLLKLWEISNIIPY